MRYLHQMKYPTLPAACVYKLADMAVACGDVEAAMTLVEHFKNIYLSNNNEYVDNKIYIYQMTKSMSGIINDRNLIYFFIYQISVINDP